MLSAAEVAALRSTHSPQPSSGRVLSGLFVALDNGAFRLWDSRTTVGYLCSTEDARLLRELLHLEARQPFSVRELITGEVSPYSLAPTSTIFNLPTTIEVEDILRRERS